LLMLWTFLILTTTSFFSSVGYTTTTRASYFFIASSGGGVRAHPLSSLAWSFGAFCCQNGVLKVWQNAATSGRVQYWLMPLSRNLNHNDLLRVALWVSEVLEQQGTCKSRELLFGQNCLSCMRGLYGYYDRGCDFGNILAIIFQ
jgi:hypothetical protein